MVIENTLGDLEDATNPVIEKILTSKRLPVFPSQELYTLLTFIVLFSSRTRYAVDEANEMLTKQAQRIAKMDPTFPGNPDEVNVEFENASHLTLAAAAQNIPIALDLQGKLLLNSTKTPFIASDNPVVFYNQFLEKRKKIGSNTGLACLGLQIIVPLSPACCLLYFDKNIYRVDNNPNIPLPLIKSKDVFQLNSLQYLNADENIYFNHELTEQDISKLVGRNSEFKREMKSNLTVFNETETLDGHLEDHHYFKEDIRCNLKLSFIRVKAKAVRYFSPGQRIYQRNEQLCRLHEMFMQKADKGEFNIHEFSKFVLSLFPEQLKFLT